MRQIEQVVAPKVNTESNSGPKTVKWNKVNPKPVDNGQIVLKPHQIEAVQSVGLPQIGARLIADEMRVGKTATAIGIDFQARADLFYRDKRKCGNNCTLIVCPKKVLGVWSDHLLRMGVAPERIVVVDLPKRDNVRAILKEISETKRKKERVGYYVILNWDSVQLLEKDIMRCGPFFHVIGDEVHRIKSRDAKRTVAFKHIPAKQKTGLSGTPADNKPEDFWSALNWVDSKTFSSYWAFVSEYCTTKTNRTGYQYITGTKQDRMVDLHEQISPFYIRRLFADVADHLPRKTYRTVTLPMTGKQRVDYDNMSVHGMADIEGVLLSASINIVELQYKQQMAIGVCALNERGKPYITGNASPKIDWIIDYLKDLDEGESVLIGCQFVPVANAIWKRARDAKISVGVITGDTQTREVDNRKHQFQSGDLRAIVGTIGALKEGLDFSRANTIIVVDRDWNPSAMEQFLARADSLENNHPVEIIYLESEDSVDQLRTASIDNKGENVKIMIGDRQ